MIPQMKRRDNASVFHISCGHVVLLLVLTFQLVLVLTQQNAPGYIGCFVDVVDDRALRTLKLEYIGQSVDWCFKYCLDTLPDDYKYLGLEYGDECFCGNNEDYGRHGKSLDSDCDYDCHGNSNQICGAPNRLSIYRISSGICSNDIGPPTNGTHAVTNPRSLSYNLNNFKFFGTRVYFYCDTGYTLQGASSIQCIETGNNVTWSDSVPTCEVSTPTDGPTINTAADENDITQITAPGTHEMSSVGVTVGSLAAGIIIGVVALGLFIICMRRRRRNQQERINEHQHKTITYDSEYQVPNKHQSAALQLNRHDIALNNLAADVEYDTIPGTKADGSVVVYSNSGPELSFSRDLVIIEKELGRGAFGRVLLGTALGIKEAGKRTKVAVKTHKEGADRQVKVGLLEELDVMKKIGSHPNIVRLLGYCIETDPVCLILEYLCKGDLKKVLMEYRTTDSVTGYVNIGGISQSLSRILVKFARDVANGMAFLASQQCIHRDLAARNVLVGEDMVCKVSDFGLARDVMNVRIYQRQSQGLLPIRWMALESILDDVYTTESDVWSFGVLVWEIVTLGAKPYPHIVSAEDMVNWLRKEYRMPKPSNCKNQLYDIMLSCWNTDPRARPTFQSVFEKLDSMLMEEMEYIVLDKLEENIYEDSATMKENEKV